MKIRNLSIVLTMMAFGLTGCLDSFVKPEAKVDKGLEDRLPAYSGKKAKLAVTNFAWKIGGSKTTIGIAGTEFSFSNEEYSGYASGLKDMLTTALVQSKRYRVLERQNIDSAKEEMKLSEEGFTDSSGITKGKVKGADIMVIAAITGWDPGTSGASGSLGSMIGGKAGALLGAVSGGYKKSSMSMDIRIVDTSTTEVLAATHVEGVAKDISIGGALGAITGKGGMGGSLGGFAKTPMEKAIRTCIYEAVLYIVENTPQEYMKH